MVHQHNPNHRPSILDAWMYGVLGTPRRFVTALLVCFLLFALVRPDVAERAFARVLASFFRAVAPFEAPAVTVLVIVFCFWVLLRPRRGHRDRH